SSVSSQKLPPLWTPLLFTRTSIRPQRAMTWSTAAWHSLLEETSVLKKTADPPAWVISSSTFLPVVSLISTLATCAPSRAKPLQNASPRPCPPPVTNTTLSLNRISIPPPNWFHGHARAQTSQEVR